MKPQQLDPKQFKTLCDEIYAKNFETYLKGRKDLFMGLLTAYFCKGHVLVEGPPGTAKTLIAKLFAKTLSKTFKRIQFTNDLMPEKITGSYYFHPGKGDYKFLPGPLFSDVILADEINRAPPVTQSAFLEAMEEKQLTIKGNTVDLGDTFFVIATQNPSDYLGTFPLPEVQLDRFIFSFYLSNLTFDEEIDIVERHLSGKLPPNFHSLDCLEIEYSQIQALLKTVKVDKTLINYAARIVGLTRHNENFQKGASLRAILAIVKGAQMGALLDGRLESNAKDIQAYVLPALRHRLFLSKIGEEKKNKIEFYIEEIIRMVDVPPPTAQNNGSNGDKKVA